MLCLFLVTHQDRSFRIKIPTGDRYLSILFSIAELWHYCYYIGEITWYRQRNKSLNRGEYGKQTVSQQKRPDAVWGVRRTGEIFRD